jgi:hypothetical protein
MLIKTRLLEEYLAYSRYLINITVIICIVSDSISKFVGLPPCGYKECKYYPLPFAPSLNLEN